MDAIEKWILGVLSGAVALLIVALLAWIFSAVLTLQMQVAGIVVQIAGWEKAVVELHDALSKEAVAVDKATDVLTRLRMDLCRTKDGHTCD